MRGWSGDPKFWSMNKGVLTGKADGTLKRNHFITWKAATVRNFDLKVKVAYPRGKQRNSVPQYPSSRVGVGRTDRIPVRRRGRKTPIQWDALRGKGRRILSHTGEKVVVDPKGDRWIVGRFEVKEFAPDQWHEYRILVEGNRHRHWIDGHPTADLIDFDEKGRALDGVLAMQVHKGPPMTIEFKEMFIKHLPDDLPLLNRRITPSLPMRSGYGPKGNYPKVGSPRLRRLIQSKALRSKGSLVDFDIFQPSNWISKDMKPVLFVPYDPKPLSPLWRGPCS